MAQALARRWALALVRELRTAPGRAEPHKRSPFVSGAFEPVSRETFVPDLVVVQGAIPEDLNGMLLRTGANPQNAVEGGYHMFDGEGMVHAVRFQGGRALSYQNHLVQGVRAQHEKVLGQELFPRTGDFAGPRGLLLVMLSVAFKWAFPGDQVTAGAAGNTSLVCHAGRLLALSESCLPFQLGFADGRLHSVGNCTFEGQVKHAFTAHPKKDPRTGELVFFHYKLPGISSDFDGSWCDWSVLTPDGACSPSRPVGLTRPQMVHDFALTENYSIFVDHALVFDARPMLRPGGMPMAVDAATPSRIGLVPRGSGSTRWFEVPSMVVFHMASAWEDGDWVHLVLCWREGIDMTALMTGVALEDATNLVRYSMNVATGEVLWTPLLPQDFHSVDFPIIPPQLVGRHARYTYTTIVAGSSEGGMTKGLVKVDMTAAAGQGHVATIELPATFMGSEAAFVPRDAGALADGSAAEDDGYLLTYVTDNAAKQSFCVVWDASTMSPTPIATVALPMRVPAGFHALFVPQHELESLEAAS